MFLTKIKMKSAASAYVSVAISVPLLFLFFTSQKTLPGSKHQNSPTAVQNALNLKSSGSSASRPLPGVPKLRNSSNIIFWSQEKTASSSTKWWFVKLGSLADLSASFYGAPKYFYSKPTDHATRIGSRACSILGGHINVRDIHSRPHEAAFGVIISNTRNAEDLLCSKYFHVSERNYVDMLPELMNQSSTASYNFWSRFRSYDPCELYRYYDGLLGCDVDEQQLSARAKAIADRLDCVIDADDPQRDADSICVMLGVKDCPEFPAVNYRSRRQEGAYASLLQLPHIQAAMNYSVRVVRILHATLMTRRCRFLTEGSGQKIVQPRLTLGNMPPPRWPSHCRKVHV